MQREDDAAYLSDGFVDLVDNDRDAFVGVGAIRRGLQVQPGGEQPLDHTVVQLASNTVPVVEYIQSSLGLDKLRGSLESLADIPNRRDRCRDRSAQLCRGDVARRKARLRVSELARALITLRGS